MVRVIMLALLIVKIKYFSHLSEKKHHQSTKELVPESTSCELQINSSTSFNNSKCVSFLPAAKVLLYNNENKAYFFRALLDSGSKCSFISENVIIILGLKRKRQNSY